MIGVIQKVCLLLICAGIAVSLVNDHYDRAIFGVLVVILAVLSDIGSRMPTRADKESDS